MSPDTAEVLLVLAPAFPLALALLWFIHPLRHLIFATLPWAALPLLLLTLTTRGTCELHLDWLMFGATLGFDDTRRLFALFTGVIWFANGLYMQGDRRLFAPSGLTVTSHNIPMLWLLTLAGNIGVIVTLDVASFYASFALMSFAVYGLLIHWHSPDALRAGRVYLVMAVLGEALILSGLLLASLYVDNPLMAQLAQIRAVLVDNPQQNLIIALLWLGFGVKAALPILHVSLPLIYTAAPIPIAAVTAGAMIKAGLLGWLNTLPLGLTTLSLWGAVLMATGMLAIFGAAFIGVQQKRAKTVLAYSSISQMGIFSIALGAVFYVPALWPWMLPAIGIYALHHGLVKACLFLNIGIISRYRQRIPYMLGFLVLLPALSLAGLMGTGILAKQSLKGALLFADPIPEGWGYLLLALSLGSVATTLLMTRYLWLLKREKYTDPLTTSMWLGWGIILSASLTLIWLPHLWGMWVKWPVSIFDWFGLIWPVLVGLVMSVAAWRWLKPLPIPAGDILYLLHPFPRMAKYIWSRLRSLINRLLLRLQRMQVTLVLYWKRNTVITRSVERLWRREASLSFAILMVIGVLVSML